MNNSHNRISPFPILLSLAQDLLPSGRHPMEKSLAHLLGDKATSNVDIVSYCADLTALRSLGVLCAREQTRVLLVPPGGMKCDHVKELLDEKLEGLTIKQADDSKVKELVHLKLIIFTRIDGRQFAVTGSANFTTAGTHADHNANCELSVLFELHSSNRAAVNNLFKTLWVQGSRDVNPDDFWTKTTDDRQSESSLILLPFQKKRLAELKAEYRKRGNGAILSLPTGAGKTLIAAKFLLDSVLKGANDSVLWIAPHDELLFQAASTFKKLRSFYRFSDLTVPDENDVVYEKQPPNRNVEFLTIQAAYINERKKTPSPKVVVIDEAHWGSTYSCEMLPHLRKIYQGAFFLGLTATPFRKEWREFWDLNKLFGNLVGEGIETLKNEIDANGQKVFSEVLHNPLKTGFKIRFDEETLEADELSKQAMKEFDKPNRNSFIAESWKPEYKKTLVFAVGVEHANHLAQAFRKVHKNVPIQVVHMDSIPKDVPSEVRPENGASLTSGQRQCIHQMFTKDKIQVLISVNIYTMGVDFPSVETLFMARPTLSPVLYAQMVGRGLRGPAFGGTKVVRVVDFTDSFDPLNDLRDRFMTYALEKKWAKKWTNELTEGRELLKEARNNSCPPAEASIKLNGCSGIYRVTTASRRKIPNRNWRWVSDIGKGVHNGRREESVKSGHVIHYLLLDDGKEGNRKVRRLKLAEKLEDINKQYEQ